MKVTTSFFLLFSLCISGSLAFLQKKYEPRVLATSGDVTKPTSYFIAGDLTTYFEFDNTDLVAVMEYNKPNQYFAVGFGTRMSGSDMWIVEISGSTVTIGDYYCTGHDTPRTDKSFGGKEDITILGYDIQATKTIVKFKRPLDTGDSKDYAITKDTKINMMWATRSASKSLEEHKGGEYGLFIAPWVTGFQGQAEMISNTPYAIHGIFMIITWGVLFDIALFIIRYMKATKPYGVAFQMWHSIFMWLTFILSSIFIALVLVYNRSKRGSSLSGDAVTDTHFFIGLIIFALSAFAVIGGVVTLLKDKNYKGNEGVRKHRKSHGYLGYFIYIFTKVEIILGCVKYNNGSWMIPVCVYLGAMFLFHVCMTFYFRKKQRDYHPLPQASTKELTHDQSKLMKFIYAGNTRAEIIKELPNLKWVIFGETVYDVSKFIHPGGNFIIEAVVGREISRFLTGACALESSKETPPYTHSAQVYDLLQTFAIGTIQNHESILVSNETQKEAKALWEHQWKLTSKTDVTKTLSAFHFSCPDFKVKPGCRTLSTFGRHFTIKSANNSTLPVRIYTTALSLTETAGQIRKAIFESATEGKPLRIEDSWKHHKDALPLFIKKYPFPQGFSKAVHEVEMDNNATNQFIIEGPMGRSLELTSASTGYYVIICAGTGILPFVDFLDYLLIKTCYEIIKEKNPGDAKKIIELGYDFERSFKKIHVRLVAAFADEAETYGLDIITKLAQVNKLRKQEVFEASLSGCKHPLVHEVSGRFNKSLLEKCFDKSAETYYVCGPPVFNRSVPEELISMGVAPQNIVLV